MNILLEKIDDEYHTFDEDKSFFYEYLANYLPSTVLDFETSDKVIDQEVYNLSNSFQDEFLKSSINYLNQGSKKYIRSKLYQTNGDDITIAALIELFHLATLIQDDVIDKAHVRRNLTTLNKLYGDNVAIVVSDLLLLEIVTKLHEILHPKLDEITCDDNKAISEFVFNQFKYVVEQMLNSELMDVSKLNETNYHNYIKGKTANLFGLSYMLGFLQEGVTLETLKLKFEQGVELGIVFQKIDDYLDVYGQVEQIGKNSMDQNNNVSNYVVINDFKQDVIFRQISNELQQVATQKDFVEVIKIIKKSLGEL